MYIHSLAYVEHYPKAHVQLNLYSYYFTYQHPLYNPYLIYGVLFHRQGIGTSSCKDLCVLNSQLGESTHLPNPLDVSWLYIKLATHVHAYVTIVYYYNSYVSTTIHAHALIP